MQNMVFCAKVFFCQNKIVSDIVSASQFVSNAAIFQQIVSPISQQIVAPIRNPSKCVEHRLTRFMLRGAKFWRNETGFVAIALQCLRCNSLPPPIDNFVQRNGSALYKPKKSIEGVFWAHFRHRQRDQALDPSSLLRGLGFANVNSWGLAKVVRLAHSIVDSFYPTERWGGVKCHVRKYTCEVRCLGNKHQTYQASAICDRLCLIRSSRKIMCQSIACDLAVTLADKSKKFNFSTSKAKESLFKMMKSSFWRKLSKFAHALPVPATMLRKLNWETSSTTIHTRRYSMVNTTILPFPRVSDVNLHAFPTAQNTGKALDSWGHG